MSPLPPKCSATHISANPDKSWDCSRVAWFLSRFIPRRAGPRRICSQRCHLPARLIILNQSHCRWRNLHSHRRYLSAHSAYTEWISKINTHHIVGWYHSHPSFGCWLSGIDVNTQELFQRSADPFLAIVVDPIKSVNLRILQLIKKNWTWQPSECIPKAIRRRVWQVWKMSRVEKQLITGSITNATTLCQSNL